MARKKPDTTQPKSKYSEYDFDDMYHFPDIRIAEERDCDFESPVDQNLAPTRTQWPRNKSRYTNLPSTLKDDEEYNMKHPGSSKKRDRSASPPLTARKASKKMCVTKSESADYIEEGFRRITESIEKLIREAREDRHAHTEVMKELLYKLSQ
ncbi:hypothetical protein BDN70DRAFT_936029 [Pholiota conissans]|uniref:Uncharacterized protein n=1 Tax=Pholiota conissans TaxID=109636 RepID=A0A9P5YT07_9AGAR|nr:hypothetical protein BDN70DRAFT_936029 [Pholiota conissans]